MLVTSALWGEDSQIPGVRWPGILDEMVRLPVQWGILSWRYPLSSSDLCMCTQGKLHLHTHIYTHTRKKNWWEVNETWYVTVWHKGWQLEGTFSEHPWVPSLCGIWKKTLHFMNGLLAYLNNPAILCFTMASFIQVIIINPNFWIQKYHRCSPS